MGNACTGSPHRIKRNVTVPSRIIQRREEKASENTDVGNNISVANTTAVTNKTNSYEPDISLQGQNRDIDALKEANQNVNKSQSAQQFASHKNLSQLEIGEYYQNKHLKNSSSDQPRSKHKKITKYIEKWDKKFSSYLNIVSPQLTESALGNDNASHIKVQAIIKSKQYRKLASNYIPSTHRWSIWKFNAQVNKYYTKGLYESLKENSSKWEGDITKDVHRTFPFEAYFSKEKSNGIGQEHLFNVLKALSLYFPNIGYAQSMNFIVGFMLLVNGGNELDAFWLFVTLARDQNFLLMGLFEKDFPLLQFYTFIFYEILQVENPKLHNHLKAQQIPDLLWLFKWFLTLFIYSLPSKSVIRIWDHILLNGSISMISISLSIIRYLETDILTSDTYSLDALFRSIKSEITQGNNENTTSGKNRRDFDIDKILASTSQIKLKNDKLAAYATQYPTKSGKILPDIYIKAYSNLHTLVNDYNKGLEFQETINSLLKRDE